MRETLGPNPEAFQDADCDHCNGSGCVYCRSKRGKEAYQKRLANDRGRFNKPEQSGSGSQPKLEKPDVDFAKVPGWNELKEKLEKEKLEKEQRGKDRKQ